MAAGGFKLKLVNPLPTQFQCPNCELLMRDPIQTMHGERACKSCYEALSVGEITSGSSSVFQDKHAKREISQLPCKCDNEPKCTWQGVVMQFEEHVKDCDYNVIKCQVCGEEVIKKDYQKHQNLDCSERNVKCQFCHLGMVASVLEDHQLGCSSKPMACPYNCGEEFMSNQTANHLSNCNPLLNGKVCPFTIFGCKHKPSKSSTKDLKKHLQENIMEHAVGATSEFVRLNQRNYALTDDLKKERERYRNLEGQLEVIITEKEYLQNEFVKSQKRTEHYEVRFRDYDSKLKPVEELSDTKQQIDDLEHKITNIEKVIEDLTNHITTYQPSSAGDYNSFKELEAKLMEKNRQVDSLETSNAMVNSTLSDIDLKLQLLEQAVYDGHQVWRLSNITQRMNDAITGKFTAIHSPPGYTIHGGYKFCCRLYLNGDGMGKGTHISLFFVIMKSEYDNLSKWPFTSRVTFKIINPKEPKLSHSESFIPDRNSSSFQKPTKEMNIAAGCPMFITLDRVRNQNFIIDDCLFFETVVAPALSGP